MSETITTEDCIEAIRDVAQELGKSPTYSEYQKVRSSPYITTITDKFGSWNDAKDAADLEQFSVGGKTKSINVEYFKEIDSPRKAYWIGLFYADGWVSSNGKFGIKLKSSDGYLLETLKKDLDSEHSLYIKNPDNPNWSKVVSFSVSRPDFVETLISHGLDGDKTDSNSLPELAPEHRPHFIRGLFDGDGTISFSNDSYESSACQITGISPGRFEILCNWIPLDTRIYERHNGAVDLSVPSDSRVEFFHYIYPDGSETEPKLARKYCTFEKYL